MIVLVALLTVVASVAPSAIAVGLGLAAILLVALAALGFWTLDLRRRKRQAELQAELVSFQGLMGDLPELAVAMDAEGRAIAVFGRPVAGLDAETLHRGLLFAVAEVDQPLVEAALAEAATQGHAEAVFTPMDPDAARINLTIQRTGPGAGSNMLVAILREASGGFGSARTPAPAEPHRVSETRAELVRLLQDAQAARDEAEAGRRRAEADAAGRARFLANMSHELRTPLNAIMGFSDIMRTGLFGELEPRYAEYAQLIHESGGHLLDLINDVLDMSKIEAQRFELAREAFDVREAVNAALRLVRLQADEADVKLRGVLPPELLVIDADRRAIKQIVLNLVSNALKFTPARGVITVSAERAAGELELVVADTGVGIAPEDLERLGRPYEQAGASGDRAQGTGLGLSLVRAFAELHGGRMAIESRLGEGTAVTVRLPVLVNRDLAPEADEEIAPAADAASAQPPSRLTNGHDGAAHAETRAVLEPRVLPTAETFASSAPKAGDGLDETRAIQRVAPGGAPDAPWETGK